ncbi:MAG: hypothetical protein DME94_01230, partial [Verrucomicrobia bacterium]
GFGLWLIARHETGNPNHELLEKQMRQQIAKSLERAAATFTPAPNALGVSEITVPVAVGKLDATADEVVTITSRFGGSATKGLQDQGRLSVLVDLPANREQDFLAAMMSIGGPRLQLRPPLQEAARRQQTRRVSSCRSWRNQRNRIDDVARHGVILSEAKNLRLFPHLYLGCQQSEMFCFAQHDKGSGHVCFAGGKFGVLAASGQ